ncbi:MAG: orotidine-5'-phosphate decarboxylase [Candidatus Marinimicrobia bacterium]|nr:orotidine-5'-phosphate decarboxylase [Candidatus Neomarinimicrobiota bacterium]MCF7850155.1 orotidine-5'-phosphate decarboxylase [Candidatus Neomarinimicrobiota bacterium]
MNTEKRNLVLDLHRIGALKFGEFKLKSGARSPFYIDLRSIISYPEIIKNIVGLLKAELADKQFDVITGIPYTALPLAAQVSVEMNVPLVYQRKEAKAYGTGKLIEGHFEKGQTCLIIDDLITTGESKFEAAEGMVQAGLKVKDFVCLIDRSYNGAEILKTKGYDLQSIITVEDMLTVLGEEGKLDDDLAQKVREFVGTPVEKPQLSFNQRMRSTESPMTLKLMETMLRKQSNLVLSLDVEGVNDFFDILEKTGPEIFMVKTHVDILEEFRGDFVPRLKALAEKHDFIIFEDRKFADIGSTVRKQFRSGEFKISEWAEYVTVHMIAGEAILDGLFGDLDVPRAGFLLARMSAKGNLISENYTRQVLDIGKRRQDCVAGYIGHGANIDDIQRFKAKIPQNQLLLMPGVNLDTKGDGLGQQYLSVEDAIAGGADAIIVGRGIVASDDPAAQAKRYREAAWNAFKAKIN